MSVKEEKEGTGDEESGSNIDGRSEIPYKVKAGAFLTTAAGGIKVFLSRLQVGYMFSKVWCDYFMYGGTLAPPP